MIVIGNRIEFDLDAMEKELQLIFSLLWTLKGTVKSIHPKFYVLKIALRQGEKCVWTFKVSLSYLLTFCWMNE